MILINNANCGLSRKGTGISNCITVLGAPDGFINVDNDFTAAASAVSITQDYINTEIKNGNFVPFNNVFNFTPNIEENVYETSPLTGQKKLVRRGLVEMSFEYTNGREWHGAASTNDHSGSKAAILVWNSGHLGFQTDDNGETLRGFRLSHQTTSPYTENDGSNTGKTMIAIQLTDTEAYNQNLVLVSEDDTDVTFNNAFNGAIDTFIEVQGTPTVGDTSIEVKLFANTSRGSAIAAVTDFTVSGQTISTAVFDPATRIVTINTDALTAGVKTIQIGSATEVAAEATGKLYSGSTTVTVA